MTGQIDADPEDLSVLEQQPGSAEEELQALGRFVAEWRHRPRPVFLVDEIREPDRELSQLVTFVFVLMDTAAAARLADAASEIRERLPRQTAEALIKGADLYGNDRRPAHADLRALVRNAIATCRSVERFTTSTQILKRYQSIAPGGIRPETSDLMSAIRGLELVPFMNMVKFAANINDLGSRQVDVLLDRSAQLGLDPRQLGQPEHVTWFIGPGELNEQADGSPAELHCPSRFLFIAPPKRSAFRDLLLVPDSVAYLSRKEAHFVAAREKIVSGQDFVHDRIVGAEAVAALGL